MSVAVLFLARGLNGGIEAVDSFLESYRAHSAGARHNLYLLVKAWETASGCADLQTRAAEVGANLIDLPDDGYDWGAYMRALDTLDEDWICCLNTHSRILSENWLDALLSAASNAKCGYAGCTGSWGTIAPSFFIWQKTARCLWKEEKGYIAPIKTGLITMQTLLNIGSLRDFPSFPNPHLRSNAFLLKRSHFIEFCKDRAIPKTKRDAWKLESGYQNLTVFLKERGLSPRVVGRDGTAYDCRDWIKSNTFRTPGQGNLLISDNQTRIYDMARGPSQRLMEITAWGESLHETSV